MDHGATVARNDTLMSAPIDREIVFLNPSTDSYVALDDIGRRIWELLEQPRRLEELVDLLAEEFEGQRETIRSDLVPFLAELEGEGIVTVNAPGAD